MRLPILLAAALAGSSAFASSAKHHKHHDLAARLQLQQQLSGKTFSLKANYSGAGFFDNWDFFSDADPTHGNVDYLPRDEAVAAGLAYVNAKGHAIIKVDSTNDIGYNGNRKSVRLTSKTPITKGQLLILDAKHMPTGCATWPAFWTLGDGVVWPTGGEIDIVEGVNNVTRNQMTLHTTAGCMTKTPMQASGTVLVSDCNVYTTGNQGCGNLDASSKSFGPGFNAQNGGVFATLWDDAGIKIWFFPFGFVPKDIYRQTPMPSTWGTPSSFWDDSACNTDQFFKNQTIVINTTLCGDWAEAVYGQQGCPGTCASQVATGSNFVNAFWSIRSVRVYG